MGKRKSRFAETDDIDPQINIPTRGKLPPLKAKTLNQERYLNQLRNCVLTFGVGAFGTGKSYIPTRYACELLSEKVIDRIIVTRPMVPAEEDPGALPGELEDKFAPYFAPIKEIMCEHFGGSHVSGLVKNDRIQIAPVNFLRGKTFKDAFALFDEAQNSTPRQMKLFLSRMGENCLACVTGDLKQMDIDVPLSGLEDAIDRLGSLPEVGVSHLGIEDIVRSGFARKVALAYN